MAPPGTARTAKPRPGRVRSGAAFGLVALMHSVETLVLSGGVVGPPKREECGAVSGERELRRLRQTDPGVLRPAARHEEDRARSEVVGSALEDDAAPEPEPERTQDRSGTVPNGQPAPARGWLRAAFSRLGRAAQPLLHRGLVRPECLRLTGLRALDLMGRRRVGSPDSIEQLGVFVQGHEVDPGVCPCLVVTDHDATLGPSV